MFPHNEIWLWIANDTKRDPQSFLVSFSHTWLKADEENKAHLYVPSLSLIHKYDLYEKWKAATSARGAESSPST